LLSQNSQRTASAISDPVTPQQLRTNSSIQPS
jgi:hypothetical protein